MFSSGSPQVLARFSWVLLCVGDSHESAAQPRPQLSSAAPRLCGLSPGFKVSSCRCRCLGASGPQADSSWSGLRGQVRVSGLSGFLPTRWFYVRQKEVSGIQFGHPAGRTGLITLETPSAASAQEIPQPPGSRAATSGAVERG